MKYQLLAKIERHLFDVFESNKEYYLSNGASKEESISWMIDSVLDDFSEDLNKFSVESFTIIKMEIQSMLNDFWDNSTQVMTKKQIKELSEYFMFRYTDDYELAGEEVDYFRKASIIISLFAETVDDFIKI